MQVRSTLQTWLSLQMDPHTSQDSMSSVKPWPTASSESVLGCSWASSWESISRSRSLRSSANSTP